MSAASQCYSKLGKNQHHRIEISEYNNRESGPKSYYFQYGLYVPSERRWLNYHRHRSLPPWARPDAIDIQKESEYIGLKKKLDHCSGKPSRLFFYSIYLNVTTLFYRKNMYFLDIYLSTFYRLFFSWKSARKGSICYVEQSQTFSTRTMYLSSLC